MLFQQRRSGQRLRWRPHGQRVRLVRPHLCVLVSSHGPVVVVETRAHLLYARAFTSIQRKPLASIVKQKKTKQPHPPKPPKNNEQDKKHTLLTIEQSRRCLFVVVARCETFKWLTCEK
jgi:hypothetical protein